MANMLHMNLFIIIVIVSGLHAKVLPRPPQYTTPAPGHRFRLVTSSELPKQIPAPISSYNLQIQATDNSHKGTTVPLQPPHSNSENHKHSHRSDLMPNFIE